MGHVYDLDAPGYRFDYGADSNVYRGRMNFDEWATMNNVKVSTDLYFYANFSCSNPAGPVLYGNMQSDNQVGSGTEPKTTWNLQ